MPAQVRNQDQLPVAADELWLVRSEACSGAWQGGQALLQQQVAEAMGRRGTGATGKMEQAREVKC
jgi:hypothetical protein